MDVPRFDDGQELVGYGKFSYLIIVRHVRERLETLYGKSPSFEDALSLSFYATNTPTPDVYVMHGNTKVCLQLSQQYFRAKDK